MTRPLKVFLSHAHAHADADAVHALYDRLVADGVDAWLDKEKQIERGFSGLEGFSRI